MQLVCVTHETEINPFGPLVGLGNHRIPVKVRICPSRLTATQNREVAHDTSINLSFVVPVVEVWCHDQE
jgi:hypothetical protein